MNFQRYMSEKYVKLLGTLFSPTLASQILRIDLMNDSSSTTAVFRMMGAGYYVLLVFTCPICNGSHLGVIKNQQVHIFSSENNKERFEAYVYIIHL